MRRVEVFVRPRKGQDALKRAMEESLSKCMAVAENAEQCRDGETGKSCKLFRLLWAPLSP